MRGMWENGWKVVSGGRNDADCDCQAGGCGGSTVDDDCSVGRDGDPGNDNDP